MQLTDTHLYSCKRIGKQTSLQTKTRTRWSCILFSACCLSSFCDVALVVRSRILSSNLGPISSLMIIHLWKPLSALPTLKKKWYFNMMTHHLIKGVAAAFLLCFCCSPRVSDWHPTTKTPYSRNSADIRHLREHSIIIIIKLYMRKTSQMLISPTTTADELIYDTSVSDDSQIAAISIHSYIVIF